MIDSKKEKVLNRPKTLTDITNKCNYETENENQSITLASVKKGGNNTTKVVNETLGLKNWINSKFDLYSLHESMSNENCKSETLTMNYNIKRSCSMIKQNMKKLMKDVDDSYAMSTTLKAIKNETTHKRLSIRHDRNIRIDVGLKEEFVDLLLNYNEVWLRLGLEVVFEAPFKAMSKSTTAYIPNCNNRMIANGESRKSINSKPPLHQKDDGSLQVPNFRLLLKIFLNDHFFNNTLFQVQYMKGKGDNVLLSNAAEEQIQFEHNNHMIESYLHLVYLLDQVRCHSEVMLMTAFSSSSEKMLFNPTSMIKSSSQILLHFCKLCLKAEGDFINHLSSFGYEVQYVQKPFYEYMLHLDDISQDMKDGVKLVALLDILLYQKHYSASSSLSTVSTSEDRKSVV